MDKLTKFCSEIRSIIGDSETLTIEDARMVVKNINDFLYTYYPNIGSTFVLGESQKYLSDFHRFWEERHKEILDCKIIEDKCEEVADALHSVYTFSDGKAFSDLYDTCGLKKKDICRVRFLTANQDFRGSLDFKKLANIFLSDPSIFDTDVIYENPEDFVQNIGISSLSQNDKRISYAKNISNFLIGLGCTPFELIHIYNRDISKLRDAIINCDGSGYGNKKADMFVRDMVVLGVWDNITGFDKIDVASDINTIKVALRTGIIKTEIPLVSSFIDIFCYQYSYIDSMNALAWRRVWEIWKSKYSAECIESPCLIDYFVYNVIGKQFCKESLSLFQCESKEHTFYWHSPLNKTCHVCRSKGVQRRKATRIARVMPCSCDQGHIAIESTDYVRSLPEGKKMHECPFRNICTENRNLQPPKSISILGKTGWLTAYTEKDEGGGGLMA